jgi:hypothetical protein
MGRKEPNTQRAILYRVGMMQVDIGGLDDAGGGHWRLDEAVDHDEDGCRRDQMMRVGTRMRVGTGASLVQAHDMGKLSLQELITLACTLIIAGSETTTSFLSTGILHLIQSPGQFLTIKQRPELVPNFVEELLRVNAHGTALTRINTEDVELSGIRIPSGSVIIPAVDAANRDPREFVRAPPSRGWRCKSR